MTIYERSPSTLATDLPNGEVVMMDVDLATYFGLEGVAAEIWGLLASPTSRDDIVNHLLSHFDVEPDVCGSETDTFLASLLERELIVASD